MARPYISWTWQDIIAAMDGIDGGIMTRTSLFVLVAVTLAVAPLLSSQESDDELRARAARLHRDAIVVDTHMRDGPGPRHAS